MKSIVFRCDANSNIGTGHFMRCLKVAVDLKKRGLKPLFVMDESSDFIKEKLDGLGVGSFEIGKGTCEFNAGDYRSWLSNEVEWDAEYTLQICKKNEVDVVVVDHYGIDERWEQYFWGQFKIVVIDDLANRKHLCNLLLDSNEYKDKYDRYLDLIPRESDVFLGSEYSLLDKKVRLIRSKKTADQNRKTIERVFVCYGGSDPTSETKKFVNLIKSKPEVDWLVVVGPFNEDKDILQQQLGQQTNVDIYVNPSNLYELMSSCDYAFGAGGTMTWERAALRVPMALTSVADNQVKLCEDLGEMGMIHYLGLAKDLGAKDYLEYFEKLKLSGVPKNFEKLADKCNGEGVERLMNWIED